MEVLEQHTYQQPGVETRVTLRRLETPFYPPTSCQRLVNGSVLEGWYGIETHRADLNMKAWIKFEEKIGSKKL